MSSSNVATKSSGDFGPGITKQAMGADAPPSSPQNVSDGVRPVICTKDSEAADAHAPDTMVQDVFHKVSGSQVTMSNALIEEFESEYMSKMFPWALKYTCGGPDFFDLLSKWQQYVEAERDSVRQPWRRFTQRVCVDPKKSFNYLQLV